MNTDHYIYNDGGRAEAGFKGRTGDCVTRAIAIVTDIPYQQVYDDLNALAKTAGPCKRRSGKQSARTGMYRRTYRSYLESPGWVWVPTMTIGSGCRVHLTAGELPSGRLIVKVSKHAVAVINGMIHDTHDCSRAGKRCVYGYFHKPAVSQAELPMAA